jgi:Na+-translocating ferredoxin:NAD+ oxidoreductase subunit G
MEPMPPRMLARLKNNKIIQAWLVLLLALCFGSSLAGIQLTLGPRIEENKINETREKVPELVLGKEQAGKAQSLEIEPRSLVVNKNGRQIAYSVLEARDPEKGRLGWVIKSSGQGYADKIELLLGMDPSAENISGIFVLEQKETPGLGNKIVTEEWRSQFIGKRTDRPLEVVKGATDRKNEISAITGATISARSVTTIVNTAVADLKGQLTAQ